MSPNFLRHLINFYPPYLGAGISVTYISPDYRKITVRMKSRFYNRNYVGTHFGGSLYSMIDPFYMLMLIKVLGKEYFVWDKAARIEFVKPGRGTVATEFKIDQHLIDTIKANTATGEKYLPELPVYVNDQEGELVLKATKTLYVRKKNHKI